MRRLALGLLTATAISGSALAAPLQTVFTIALENHNFTQLTTPAGQPQQLLGNPAAPYLNSLVTPGNSNAQFTSFFSRMTNVAPGAKTVRLELPGHKPWSASVRVTVGQRVRVAASLEEGTDDNNNP